MDVWIKGLVAAAIAGAGSAGSAIVLDSAHFNLQNLSHLGIVAGTGALFGAIGYLAKSPIPSQQ